MHGKKLLILAALLISATLIKAVFATDQIKTSSSLVYSSDSQISNNLSVPFNLYIGDDISGVLNPIKSAHLEVEGVYSGGGSITLFLESHPASSKTFILPSVASPTPLEIDFEITDDLDISSPGSYDYNLQINPSGVVVSALAVVAKTTHQYSPSSCPDGQPSSQKIKTMHYFVASKPEQISSEFETPFELYIGDDISGITDPIKSAFVEIAGVYTGGGSITLTVDSKGDSLKNFTLPNVSSPTRFNILYSVSSSLGVSSAGQYDYLLNINPSGITVSGLGIILKTTHQYKPASCGTGYHIFGDMISPTFSTTVSAHGQAYNSLLWKGALGGPSLNQGKVKFQIAASDSTSGPWTFIGGSSCTAGDWFEPSGPDTPIELKCYSNLNNKKYFKYKVRICSKDCVIGGDFTPTVSDVIVNISP